MPLSGKWHFAAITGCLGAGALVSHQIPVLLFLSGYCLFLICRGHVELFVLISAVLLFLALDVFFLHWGPSGHTRLKPGMVNLSGKITDSPIIDGDQLTFNLRMESGEIVRVNVRIPTEKVKNQLSDSLGPGQLCRPSGELSRPPEPTNFHAFDFRRYLEHQGIYWQLSSNGVPRCFKESLSVIDQLKQLRQDQMHHVRETYSPAAAAMINALIFGEDSGINPDLERAYQLFGIVHLLVVSGMHVAVIFGCLFYIFRRIGWVREHIMIGFLILIPIYVLLSGSEPSIVRSGLTSELFLLTGLIKKIKPRPEDILSIACLIMIFYDPNTVFDLGFQLSFIVTFSLLVAAPSIIEKYSSPLIKASVLSLISELVSFPIIIPNFYQFSLLSFPIGLLFAPYITLIILPLTGIAYFASILFPPAVPMISPMLDLFLHAPHEGLLFLYRHPVLQLTYGSLSFWETAAALALISSTLILWEKIDRKWSLPLLLAPFLVIYGIVNLNHLVHPYGTVTFFDVGQGDSILVQLPRGEGNILIDTGGTLSFNKEPWRRKRDPFEVGRDVVLDELRAMGISSLDVVILSHRDTDHIGGLKGLAGQMPIKKIVVSPYFDPDQEDKKLFSKLRDQGTQFIVAKDGNTIRVNDTLFYVLGPERRASSNDNSLVIAAELGGKRWLFTGDMEAEGEQGLVARYPSLHADILKAGHHGSRTATTAPFLDRLHPSIAVISSGKNNRYGHPHQEVLKLLSDRAVRVMRTDQTGALQFTFTQSEIVNIETAVKR